VLGELTLTASRLPQLLAQVGRWLNAALASGQLGCDDDTDPTIAVSEAWTFRHAYGIPDPTSHERNQDGLDR
jgi:hypothetical protein